MPARLDVLELLLHSILLGSLLEPIPLCERERNADQSWMKVGLAIFLVPAPYVNEWQLVRNGDEPVAADVGFSVAACSMAESISSISSTS